MFSAFISLSCLLTGGAALILKDDVGKLPALGWNSWNAYACNISESAFITAAEKFVELGFKDAGYEYVNIDDCWSVKDHRDNVTHRLIPDPDRFPDGIKGTANKIHALGLKIGIYSSAGTKTCGGYPASIGFESVDAATWAEWGIDYLKYDNCYVPSNWTDECNYCVPDSQDGVINGTCTLDPSLCSSGYNYTQSNTAKRYRIMRDALLAQNRTILYSLCEWGQAGVESWGNETSSSWRMSGDINNTWARILQIFNENSFYLNSVDFWGHPDADMLEVGNDLAHPQAKSHFAFWAAMKSPLLIGTDLAKISEEDVAILTNPYLLAFSQDQVYGKPATPYKWGTNPDWTFNASFPAEYWSGASSNGTLVLMLNPYGDAMNKTADFKEIPQLDEGSSYQVYDIWTGEDLGCISESIEVEVAAYDTAGLLVKACEGSKESFGAGVGVGGGQRLVKLEP